MAPPFPISMGCGGWGWGSNPPGCMNINLAPPPPQKKKEQKENLVIQAFGLSISNNVGISGIVMACFRFHCITYRFHIGITLSCYFCIPSPILCGRERIDAK
jgi:hypothetical protein